MDRNDPMRLSFDYWTFLARSMPVRLSKRMMPVRSISEPFASLTLISVSIAYLLDTRINNIASLRVLI
jgi:hypothetical protein